MPSASETTRFICLFHSADRARSVVDALQQANIPSQAITTIGGDERLEKADREAVLADIGVPERDLAHLRDGLQHGGVIVTLTALESQSSVIERIFHRYSADKVDETAIDAGEDRPIAATPIVPPAVVPADAAEIVTGEAVIPIAEESLLVGKREVDRGGVRVFRRTVEEPVQQEVTLHNERVALEYREVNRPVTDADLQAGNRQIELVETAEIPVVEKVARVVEEVRVGKQTSDHTEVVSDTVRHTEVEVEPLDVNGQTTTDSTGIRRD